MSRRTLAVHDLDEALAFYRDVLGFNVVHRDAQQATVSSPNAQVVLAASPDLEDPSELTVPTDDCDAAFERTEAAGAEVMQEPITRPDGTRTCAFLDPSGNTLRFIQSAGHR